MQATLDLLGTIPFEGRDIYLKCNFNSGDPFPATTHVDTLRHVARQLRVQKCARIILVERSGMGSTRSIWKKLGVDALSEELGMTLVALEEAGDWKREDLPGSHWSKGIEVPGFLNGDVCVVQVANLKTHRFGGQFSASLKNSIGLIAKHSHFGDRHNYMEDLHGSPNQRLMIAEVNQVYKPALVLMDATQVFIDGGPESGEVASPEVFLGSRDRVALDAAGAALLRHLGAGSPLDRIPIFELEQIKRAVDLGLGAKSGQEIQLLTPDSESANLATTLKSIIMEAPKSQKV